jgi:hypothetical protein
MSKKSPPTLRGGFSLSIAYLPIDQLKPDPKNARQHTAKQIRQRPALD